MYRITQIRINRGKEHSPLLLFFVAQVSDGSRGRGLLTSKNVYLPITDNQWRGGGPVNGRANVPRFADAFIRGKEFAVSSCRLKIDPRIKLGINADSKRGNWLTLNLGAA